MSKNKIVEKATLLWQVGEWEKLTELITSAELHHAKDKEDIALMIAIAYFQLGNEKKAKRVLKLAKNFGATKKQIAKQITSSLYNTLGRVKAINGDDKEASKYFKKSITFGKPKIFFENSVQFRMMQEYTSLNLPLKYKNQTTSSEKIKLKVQVLSEHNLGDAWAGNSVNTVIFRHHGIVTWGINQYTAFYVDETTLRIVKRNLDSDTVVEFDLKGTYNLRDAHNSISLGIDNSGSIHICYDHHGTKLRYRRTTIPEDISLWSDELSMTGVKEEKLTYPTFILPSNNEPLLILYRDGNWKKGAAYIKSYDEASQKWHDYDEVILSGAEQKPWTSNAYWNHPVSSNDGSLHISYVWRTDYCSEEKLVNNMNIGYARSYDRGKSWITSNGQPYKLPITQVNSEVVCQVTPNENLINQTSMATDSNGYPHIATYANDKDGIPQYQHIWFDGEKWHMQCVSSNTEKFSLQGGGTLKIPMSRPEILVDKNDTVYVIYRSDETNQKFVATSLKAPYYIYSPDSTVELYSESVGYAEPIIDKTRWGEEDVLSMLVQYNEQPDGDIGHDNIMKEIKIIDIQFEDKDLV